MLIALEMFRLLLGLCLGDCITLWSRTVATMLENIWRFSFVCKGASAQKLHEASRPQPGWKVIEASWTSGDFSRSEPSWISLSTQLKQAVSLLTRLVKLLWCRKQNLPCCFQLTASQKVYVSCHYCGKSVSPWYKGLPRVGKTGSLQRTGGAANKVQSLDVQDLNPGFCGVILETSFELAFRWSCSPAPVVRSLSRDAQSVWSIWERPVGPMFSLGVNRTGDVKLSLCLMRGFGNLILQASVSVWGVVHMVSEL